MNNIKNNDKEYFLNIGMSVFYELANKLPLFSANENTFLNFISILATQHTAAIRKYKETNQLNEIYAFELAKFYHITTSIPLEELRNDFLNLLCKINVPEIEKAIIYPAFTYKKDPDTNQTAHIPMMHIYILGGKKIKKINNKKEELNGLLNAEDLVDSLAHAAQSITKHWANDFTSQEQDLISDYIYFYLFIQNKAAVKTSVFIQAGLI